MFGSYVWFRVSLHKLLALSSLVSFFYSHRRSFSFSSSSFYVVEQILSYFIWNSSLSSILIIVSHRPFLIKKKRWWRRRRTTSRRKSNFENTLWLSSYLSSRYSFYLEENINEFLFSRLVCMKYQKEY